MGSSVKILAIILFLSLFLVETQRAQAADNNAAVQGQMETTLINVDKYGVYVPNYVFYWNSEMSKDQLANMTSLATKSRNKKVNISYSAIGDVNTDRRPILVNIEAIKEEPRHFEDNVIGSRDDEPVSDLGTITASSDLYSTNLDIENNVVDKNEEPKDTTSSRYNKDINNQPYDDHLAKMNRKQNTDEFERYQAGGHANDSISNRDNSTFVSNSDNITSTTMSHHDAPITRQEVTSFIQFCVNSNELKNLGAALSCYADEVNYYTRGMVDRQYIKKDKGFYFKNWDTINSQLGDIVVIVTDQQDLRIAKFKSHFFVANTKRALSGDAENVWKIQRINNQLRIVDEKQRVVNSQVQLEVGNSPK